MVFAYNTTAPSTLSMCMPRICHWPFGQRMNEIQPLNIIRYTHTTVVIVCMFSLVRVYAYCILCVLFMREYVCVRCKRQNG